MKVLVACEFSGRVRDAFAALGHDAISCDLLPSETPGKHYQGNVLDIINEGFDLMIAHPPCTYLTVSGNRWFLPQYSEMFPDREMDRERAKLFFLALVSANIPKIAIENPIGIMSSVYRKPDQIIHPWMFGHPETKATCLWLKGLNPLSPNNIVEPEYVIGKDGKRYSPIHYMSKGNKDRQKLRSITYHGIAKAMAQQWGVL